MKNIIDYRFLYFFFFIALWVVYHLIDTISFTNCFEDNIDNNIVSTSATHEAFKKKDYELKRNTPHLISIYFPSGQTVLIIS